MDIIVKILSEAVLQLLDRPKDQDDSSSQDRADAHVHKGKRKLGQNGHHQSSKVEVFRNARALDYGLLSQALMLYHQ